MKRSIAALVAVAGVGLCLPGCAGDSGTNPTLNAVAGNATPKTVAGNYSGSGQNTFQGVGVMNMTLAQSGGLLSGTWSVTFLGGGSLTGSVPGSSIAVTLLPSNPTPCPSYDATATFDGGRLTGAYTSPNCPKAMAGDLVALRTRDAAFSLSKQ